MARIEDLPLWLRTTLRIYPWRQVDPVPHAKLRKSIADCRVALVTTAGLVRPEQPPFDAAIKGGDCSYRVIDRGVDVRSLGEFHRSSSFDHRGVEQDRNLAFPLDRLRELESQREIGEVAPRHLSFMGSITAPGRLVKRTLPEAANLFVEDKVDIALLVPV